MCAALGCGSEQVALRVSIASDFAPGTEATSVVVELSDGQRIERSITSSDDLLDPPLGVGTFVVERGAYTVDAQLFAITEVLGEESLVIQVRDDFPLTINFPRAGCIGVGCPNCQTDADCGVVPSADGGRTDAEPTDGSADGERPDSEPLDAATDGDLDSEAPQDTSPPTDTNISEDADEPVDAPAADSTSNDAATAPAITVEETASRLTATAEGRFRLVFDAAHAWQVTDWFDLQTNPSLDLGGLNSGVARFDVLQSPLQIETAGWIYQGDASSSELLSWSQPTAESLRVDTQWTWIDRGTTLTMTATHLVESTGVWTVRVELSTDRETVIDAHDFGFTNVNRLSEWTLSEASNSFTWRRDGAGMQPAIQVTTFVIATVGNAASENAFYISGVDQTINPTRSFMVQWQNRIWPPIP